jgi:hypothetical protein
VNIHALLRTYWLCFFLPKPKSSAAPLHWDKTDHEFPSAEIMQRTNKLGQLAIQQGLITQSELLSILDIQTLTGKKLGEILIEKKYITEYQLFQLRAEQYQLPLTTRAQVKLLFANDLPKMSSSSYRKLIRNGVYPLGLNNNMITLGIVDPANELSLTATRELIKPYQSKFVLFDPLLDQL